MCSDLFLQNYNNYKRISVLHKESPGLCKQQTSPYLFRAIDIVPLAINSSSKVGSQIRNSVYKSS